MRQWQRKEGEAIQDAVNEGDPLNWPSIEGNAINEFKTAFKLLSPRCFRMGRVTQPIGQEIMT